MNCIENKSPKNALIYNLNLMQFMIYPRSVELLNRFKSIYIDLNWYWFTLTLVETMSAFCVLISWKTLSVFDLSWLKGSLIRICSLDVLLIFTSSGNSLIPLLRLSGNQYLHLNYIKMSLTSVIDQPTFPSHMLSAPLINYIPILLSLQMVNLYDLNQFRLI